MDGGRAEEEGKGRRERVGGIERSDKVIRRISIRNAINLNVTRLKMQERRPR